MAGDRTPPLVSVALATCNGARYLPAQLDSIYAQTHTPIEVVASDDCSDDDTPAILERYATSHGVRVLRNPRRLGIKRNFETALHHCRGRFIALADQDDVWYADKLERLLACQRESGVSLVYSDADLVDGVGRPLGARLRETLEVEYLRGRPRASLYLENWITGCTVLFDRQLLDSALPLPGGAHMHDWWLAFAATLADGLDFVDAPLLGYRQHDSNQVGAHAPRRRSRAVRVLRAANPLESIRRLRHVRAWHRRNTEHLRACAQLERRAGVDDALCGALLEWLRDQARCWNMQRHRRLFEEHPELLAALAPARRAEALEQRLWSLPKLAVASTVHVGASVALASVAGISLLR